MNKKIEQILEQIAAPHQLDILWKGVGGHGHDCGLSPQHTLHCNHFCRAVKSNPERLKKCSMNDNHFLPVEAEKQQRPFIRRCHAGVSELVVPHLTDGNCTEVILLGVFREVGDCCPYRELDSLYDALPLYRPGELDATGALLNNLLPILRHYRESIREKAETVKDPRIREAAAIMRRKFATGLTAPQMASLVCLSKSRFLHLFKACTGSSFSTFLLNIRLNHAAELLRNTGLGIREIMENSGFNDQSYFSVRFKKHSGYSPLTYRRKFSRIGDI